MKSESLKKHFDVLRTDLLNTGAVENVAEASSPSTNVMECHDGLQLEGQGSEQAAIIGTVFVSLDYGKTIGWNLLEGRDFSRDFSRPTVVLLF